VSPSASSTLSVLRLEDGVNRSLSNIPNVQNHQIVSPLEEGSRHTFLDSVDLRLQMLPNTVCSTPGIHLHFTIVESAIELTETT
jgi:hypothetical protein